MPTSVLKDTFFKIPKKKQDHILKCALKEFAKRGLSGTNILDVAKRAKISVGSLYTYVDSKEELYVAVAENLVTQMIDEMDQLKIKDSFMDNVCMLFEAVNNSGRNKSDAMRFYFDMMTEMVTPKIKDATLRLEAAKREKYIMIIDQAIENQEVAETVERDLLAFMLDGYLQTFQLALTTTHYRNKTKVYFGTNQPEELGRKMCDYFELSFAKTTTAE